MSNAIKPILFLIYLILGFYLINFAFNIVTLPTFDNPINSWIMALIGVLMVFGGINYLRASKNPYNYPRR
ncbi:MAG TPA: hypothetical protein VJH92_01255 [Candidatus Nanoarchaeia archaeon]|nr:hypothetical protein [Candidatus Nanoarchaeia archaeon]